LHPIKTNSCYDKKIKKLERYQRKLCQVLKPNSFFELSPEKKTHLKTNRVLIAFFGELVTVLHHAQHGLEKDLQEDANFLIGHLTLEAVLTLHVVGLEGVGVQVAKSG